MAAGSPQFDYLDGQLRASHAALFERFAAGSERAIRECRPSLDLCYGPHPRQTLDLFSAAGAARAVVAYLHGGYWQSRDKSDFSFVAPPLVADGFDVALVNYPLCPEVSVAEILAAAMALVPRLAELAEGAPIILIGHSAGGQIAVELGMAAFERGWNLTGIVATSGVFDLVPLIGTTLNARLALDEASARRASPLCRAIPSAPPALFAVGADETPAFHEQTRRMSEAWAAAGNAARQIVVPNADHFSILECLSDGEGALRRAMRGFFPGG